MGTASTRQRYLEHKVRVDRRRCPVRYLEEQEQRQIPVGRAEREREPGVGRVDGLAEDEHHAVERQVVELHLHARLQILDNRLGHPGVEHVPQQVDDDT